MQTILPKHLFSNGRGSIGLKKTNFISFHVSTRRKFIRETFPPAKNNQLFLLKIHNYFFLPTRCSRLIQNTFANAQAHGRNFIIWVTDVFVLSPSTIVQFNSLSLSFSLSLDVDTQNVYNIFFVSSIYFFASLNVI